MRNYYSPEDQLVEAPAPEVSAADNRVVVGSTDSTERKYREDAARQEQKMAALGGLATGMVDDFNNLLTAILGYCDILLREPRVAGDARGSVQQILRVAEWGTALTRQLLAYAREQAAEPRVLDLRAVVTETHAMLRRLIGANIELETVLGPDLGHVRADPAQVEQLLVHLVVHARDALPEGGRITLEAADVAVEAGGGFGDLPPGAYVRLVVADTGSGRERSKGTGLELCTVWQIVKQSGGHVTVSGHPGRGTRVEIYLPRVEEAVSAEASAHPLGRGSETILVVEDETAIRDVICRTLRHEGYTVLEAGDGVEALAVCEQYRGLIQLLVADLVLPRMNGPALVAQLTALYRNLKVLYLSGCPQQTEGSFLSKPFTLDCLTRMVRTVLDGNVRVAT